MRNRDDELILEHLVNNAVGAKLFARRGALDQAFTKIMDSYDMLSATCAGRPARAEDAAEGDRVLADDARGGQACGRSPGRGHCVSREGRCLQDSEVEGRDDPRSETLGRCSRD